MRAGVVGVKEVRELVKASMTAANQYVNEKARIDHPTPTGNVTPHHIRLKGKGPDDPPEGSILANPRNYRYFR